MSHWFRLGEGRFLGAVSLSSIYLAWLDKVALNWLPSYLTWLSWLKLSWLDLLDLAGLTWFIWLKFSLPTLLICLTCLTYLLNLLIRFFWIPSEKERITISISHPTISMPHLYDPCLSEGLWLFISKPVGETWQPCDDDSGFLLFLCFAVCWLNCY